MHPKKQNKKSLHPNIGGYFKDVYDFVRLKKIKESEDRSQKYNKKLDKREKTLRSSLDIGEKVLVSAERLRKKDLSKKTIQKHNRK